MYVVLVRVDSRLFHGQILEGWIPSTGTTMVIVADDSAASNPFRRKIMETAVPGNVKLRVDTIDEAMADLENVSYAQESIMILFSSPHDALEAYNRGMKYGSINLGNINYASGRVQITPCIALSEEDVEDIRALAEKGIDIDVRGVPCEEPCGVEKLLNSYFELCRRQP